MALKRWQRWLLAALIALAALAAGAWYVLSLPQFGAPLQGARLARAQANPHYRKGAFVNPLPPAERQPGDTWNLLKRQFGGDEQRTPLAPLPMRHPNPRQLADAANGLQAFWIGHASVYVQIDGVRMLVDPIFSDYASPLPLGPRRFQPPPIALADLPPIDAVLITHDHYDHLDMVTVQALARRGSHFYVPLGIGAHLEAWGIAPSQIHDMAWWEELTVKGVRIVATPNRHYSGRTLNDKNHTLWASWSVLGPQHRYYVSGDTGYSPHFRAIGERFGPFDVAFIKIGAYGPGAAWLDIHMSPEDAVRAHGELRAKRLFPVHWATFNLAFHDWNEPIKRAASAAKAANADLLTPRLGELIDLDQAYTNTLWWTP